MVAGTINRIKSGPPDRKVQPVSKPEPLSTTYVPSFSVGGGKGELVTAFPIWGNIAMQSPNIGIKIIFFIRNVLG